MNIYILFLFSKTHKEILSVYACEEKAKLERNNFMKKLGGSSPVELFIVKKKLIMDEK